MPQNNRKTSEKPLDFQRGRDRTSTIHQLTLSDYLASSRKDNSLTKEQICHLLKIPDSELSKCRIGGFLELDSCVILHQGRNRWRLLEI